MSGGTFDVQVLDDGSIVLPVDFARIHGYRRGTSVKLHPELKSLPPGQSLLPQSPVLHPDDAWFLVTVGVLEPIRIPRHRVRAKGFPPGSIVTLQPEVDNRSFEELISDGVKWQEAHHLPQEDDETLAALAVEAVREVRRERRQSSHPDADSS